MKGKQDSLESAHSDWLTKLNWPLPNMRKLAQLTAHKLSHSFTLLALKVRINTEKIESIWVSSFHVFVASLCSSASWIVYWDVRDHIHTHKPTYICRSDSNEHNCHTHTHIHIDQNDGTHEMPTLIGRCIIKIDKTPM